MAYVPSTWPGVRLPHVWLDGRHGGPRPRRLWPRLHPAALRRRGDVGAARRAFAARGAPYTVLELPDTRARDVYGYDLILVRPDLHVVWRGNALPDDPLGSRRWRRGIEGIEEEGAVDGLSLMRPIPPFRRVASRTPERQFHSPYRGYGASTATLRPRRQWRISSPAPVRKPGLPGKRVIGPLSRSMHHAGGSGGRKNDAWRCSGVRQRGAAVLTAAINSAGSARTSHRRAMPSLDAVATRLPSGLKAAPNTRSGWQRTANAPPWNRCPTAAQNCPRRR